MLKNILLFSIFSPKYLEVWNLLITFAFVILRIAGDGSLAIIQGLAYFNKKDVCFTFSSDQLKPRKFQ